MREKVTDALKKMKGGSVSGLNGIGVELLKYDGFNGGLLTEDTQ